MRGLLTILSDVESENLPTDDSDESIESLFGILKSNRGVSLNQMEVATVSEKINPLKDSVMFEGDIVSPTKVSWTEDS